VRISIYLITTQRGTLAPQYCGVQPSTSLFFGNKKNIREGYLLIFRWYPEGTLSQTLDSQALELYKSAIIKSKDYINAIYAHVEYYHKDKVKELFGDLVVA